MSTDRDTVRSYDAVAAEYAAEAAAMPEWVATEIDAFVTGLGGSGRVLEIGSGGGRDALELEKRGISVRRTEKGFVELLRESGRPVGPADRRPGRPAASRHAVRRDLGLCLPDPCAGGFRLLRVEGPVADCTPRLERAMARMCPHTAALQRLGATSRRTGASCPAVCSHRRRLDVSEVRRCMESRMIGG